MLTLFSEIGTLFIHYNKNDSEMQKVADAADISVLFFFQLVLIFGPFWVIFGPIWTILGYFE